MNLRPRGKYEKVDSGFDPLPLLKMVVRAWPIYLVMLFAGALTGHFLVKNAKPKYQIDASIKVNRSFEIPTYGNEENITGLRIFSKICNIYNYIGRINTRDVLSKAYRSKNLEVKVLKKNQRLIKETPFIIHHSPLGTVPLEAKFNVASISDDSCRIRLNPGNFKQYDYLQSTGAEKLHYKAIDTIMAFQDTLQLPGTAIHLEPTDHFELDSVSFEFEDLSATLNDYQQRLRIKTLNKGASAITISITTDQTEKDKVFISSIMETFANKDLQIKKALSSSTFSFLNGEQQQLEDSLISHRMRLAKFKSENRFMNLEKHSITVLNKLEKIDRDLATLSTKERYYSFLLSGIVNQVAIDTILAPVLHTEQDVFLVELVTQYRKAQLDLEEISFYAGPKNPGLLQKKAEIEWLEKSIVDGINNMIAKIQIEKEQLGHRERKEKRGLQKLPKQERENIHLERLLAQDLSQLNYLQKKSTGAGLALHTLLPDIEILQAPLIKGNKSVTPLNAVAYAFLIIIALCIPFLFQQIQASVKGTIMVTDDINKRSNFSLLAVLPAFKKVNWFKEKLGIKEDRSAYHEAMLQLTSTPEIRDAALLKVAISGSRTKVGVSTFINALIPLITGENGLMFLSFIPSEEKMHNGKDFLYSNEIPEPSPFQPIVKVNLSSLISDELISSEDAKLLISKLCSGKWNLIVELPDLRCPVKALEHVCNVVDHHWIVCEDMRSSLADLESVTESVQFNSSVIYNKSITITPWYLRSRNTRLRRLSLPTKRLLSSLRRSKPQYRTERQ